MNAQCMKFTVLMYNVWYIWYVWNAPHGKIKGFQNWTEHAMIFIPKYIKVSLTPCKQFWHNVSLKQWVKQLFKVFW